MRIENWAPAQITAEIEKTAMDRLERAAMTVRDKAVQILNARVKKPGISRPVAKSGKYAGKAWTARVPGTLAKSGRVVRLYGDPKLDVRIYFGSERSSDRLTAYYAHMTEYGLAGQTAQPFLRPALNASKSAIMSAMESGETFTLGMPGDPLLSKTGW